MMDGDVALALLFCADALCTTGVMGNGQNAL